ncbi:PAS domain S-box protein, partial [bacterium]
VVTTAQEGPLRGTLLMGRTIDQATLGSISDDLMFDLHIAAAGSAGALALQKDRTQNIAVTELSTREISGTVRVDDPDNSMSFAVEFIRPRNIYANGLATTLLFLGVFVVCAAFTAIIGFLLIKRLALAMKRQQASEEYFSLLAKNSREIMIFTTFPGLKIIEANEAALQASGYSREKLTGLHFSDLGKPEIDMQRPDFWERIRKDGKIYRMELRCQDGRHLPVEVNVEAALSDGGRILTFLIRDISDRTEHERVIEGMSQISNSLRTTVSIAESVPILLDQVHQMYQADGVALLLWRAKLGRFQLYQATGEWESLNGYDLSSIFNLLHTYFDKINVVTTGVARFFIRNLNINLPIQLNEIGAVRIVNQEQLNGVLVVGRKTPFNHSDELLLEALADLTASTLHRANLFEQTREYARQIEAVEGVGRTLAETLDLGEIHPRLVEALLSTFDGLESVAIWQHDQQSGTIERVIGMRYEGSPLPPAQAIPGEILAAMETQKTHLMGGPLGERPEAGTAQQPVQG